VPLSTLIGVEMLGTAAPLSPTATSWWGDAADLTELQAVAAAMTSLAKDPALFRDALAAFRAGDERRFRADLDRAGVPEPGFSGLHSPALLALLGPGDDEDPVATGEAVAQLAANPELFNEALAAFRTRDEPRWHAALDRAKLLDRCELICHFFGRKECVRICALFCPEPLKPPTDLEVLQFAQALASLTKSQPDLDRLYAVIDQASAATNTDQTAVAVRAWQAELTRLQLSPYCHQLCEFLCTWRWQIVCRLLCPRNPEITLVGSIPTFQISAQGFANGPSRNADYDTQVGSDAMPLGPTGNHPFGGSAVLKGAFHFAAATQYQVLVADAAAGPYQPIQNVVVQGHNFSDPPGTDVFLTPSTGPDPGWYNVNQIADTNGGHTNQDTGEKTLMNLPTFPLLSDGLHFLRLAVRDGVGPGHSTRLSDPLPLQIDNTGPFRGMMADKPLITLQLQKLNPDGTLNGPPGPLLKCSRVNPGEGVIVVTVQANDPNYSSIDVEAQGDSGLSVPLVSTTMVPLGKSYNGDLTDSGYPVPTAFLWDPWSDTRIIKPCCYLIRVTIRDRAVVNNGTAGPHSSTNWEAIEIGGP
jgi:hypothetical protein